MTDDKKPATPSVTKSFEETAPVSNVDAAAKIEEIMDAQRRHDAEKLGSKVVDKATDALRTILNMRI